MSKNKKLRDHLEGFSKYGDVQILINETNEESKAEAGTRYDADKPRFDLIPAYPMMELAKVYTMGAKKYDDRNWEKGMSWSKVIASLQRHLWKFQGGEDIDEESGLNHMVHVAWNAFTLIQYSLSFPELDDRSKLQNKLFYKGPISTSIDIEKELLKQTTGRIK